MNRKDHQEDTGHIRIDGDTLTYTSSLYGNWAINLAEVKAIGEHTNQDGPFLDDYFFAFIINPEDGWFEASFYIPEREILLTELKKRFGPMAACELSSSTDFKSRIWWPAELAGEPMFEYRKTKDFWGRLGFKNEQWIAPRLEMFLKEKSSQPNHARDR